MIYGVALLAVCFLIGKLAGELLGQWMGVDANVGGVGFSMVLLILAMPWMQRLRVRVEGWDKGIVFWSQLYIPVIVAMSAVQNVKGAIGIGLIAVLAGVVPTAICMMLVPLISRLGRGGTNESADGSDH